MRRQRRKLVLPRAQRGFSLVESLVAIALSLIVLAGVLAVMYSSKVIYNENERVGRLQESGRAALDLILRDLRGAGFPGCAQPISGLFDLNNVLANNTEVEWNLGQPVFGYEAGDTAWTPTLDTDLIPDATAGNDIIVVRTIPTGSPSMRVTAMVSPTADINVSKDIGEELRAGTPAVISDCGNATVFVVSDFEAVDDVTAVIKHEDGGGPPANTSDSLNATFTMGARVAPITSVVYYVAPSVAGPGPALWRVIADGDPQEIVPGVEAMQVRYGVDSADNDGDVDQYVDADDVTDWAQVISVSIAILIRSAEENAQEQDNRKYQLLEKELPAFDDNYQRSLFTTTVTLRNRTP